MTKTLNRRWALGFCTYAGATAPTSDSEIGMVDGIGEVWLTNSINGLNAIDDSATVPICRYFEGPNDDDYKMGHYILNNRVEDREIIVTWANNAVNSAVAYMETPLTDREDKE